MLQGIESPSAIPSALTLQTRHGRASGKCREKYSTQVPKHSDISGREIAYPRQGGEHLVGRVATVSITPIKDDIVRFLRVKINEDTTQDAMDKSF